ncbi:MAG: MIP/aquaporin family protein [Bdellovibrionota bacterium]
MTFKLRKKLLAEFMGTAFLLAIVVGSGIMGDQLSGGNVAIALLANSLATGAGLAVLILMFGAISGAHFNPVVTLVESLRGHLSKRVAGLYVLAQGLGAFVGVLVAHLMFNQSAYSLSLHERAGPSQWLSEFVATFGLIAVIRAVSKYRNSDVPYAVGAYIASAYWFTSSTSFANPAVTLARAFTSTFAGIRPADVLAFCVFQILGAVAADYVFRGLEKTND